MKITNLNTRSRKKLRLVSIDISTIEHSITKRLLEKYKPRHLCKADGMSDVNARKRVA